MKRLEPREVYFRGSNNFYKRCIYKTDDGRFWVRWNGELIQVYNKYGLHHDYATEGWRTVGEY